MDRKSKRTASGRNGVPGQKGAVRRCRSFAGGDIRPEYAIIGGAPGIDSSRGQSRVKQGKEPHGGAKAGFDHRGTGFDRAVFGLYGGASLSLLPTNRLPPGAPFRTEATNPKQDDTSDKTPPCRPVPDPRAGRIVQPGLPGAANPHQRPCGRSGGRGHSLCQRRPAPHPRHAQHPLRMRYRPQRQLPSGGNSRRRLPAESLLHRWLRCPGCTSIARPTRWRR